MKIRGFILLFMIVLIDNVYAQDFSVYRIYPTTATCPEGCLIGGTESFVKTGEKFNVTIVITNFGTESKSLRVEEFIPSNETEPPCEWKEYYCSLVFNIDLDADQTKSITYNVTLPKIHNKYDFPPTIVTDGIMTVESEIFRVITTCNQNGVCEIDLDESYASCPEDCPSGSLDDFCDSMNDDICDPDCEKERDWDCHCSDNRCDARLGEDRMNCPIDCKGGGVKFNLVYLIIPLIFILIILSVWWWRK